MQITTIGLDIAKNVFQVHGIDAAEKVVVRKQLRRGQVMKFFAALPPCLIGMEACARSQTLGSRLRLLLNEQWTRLGQVVLAVHDPAAIIAVIAKNGVLVTLFRLNDDYAPVELG